ncbi:hypothetical protein M2437_003768 [Methylorubrum pseudosasae]|nr:hypothetical protein [Methylorubrum pseudosasae]
MRSSGVGNGFWTRAAGSATGIGAGRRHIIDRRGGPTQTGEQPLALLDQGLPLSQGGKPVLDAAALRVALGRRAVEGALKGADPLLVGKLHRALARNEAGQHLVVEDEVVARGRRPERRDGEPEAERPDETALGERGKAGFAAGLSSRWHGTSDVRRRARSQTIKVKEA